jgi:hypothetical protein
MIQVDSRAMAAVGYDGHTLAVAFHSGKTYDHPGVPDSVYREFMAASSLVVYYGRPIRGRNQ